jgi:condensation domain-containing protein/AMP-binding enzyme
VSPADTPGGAAGNPAGDPAKDQAAGPPADRLSGRLAALSPEQRALFEKLRRAQAPPRSGASRTPPPVAPVSGPLGLGDWPLTYDQERLWRLHQAHPGMISWNVDAGSYVSGDLDLPLFLAAIRLLVRRHAAWRTTFPAVDGRPVQRVVEHLEPSTTLIDLLALPQELRERAGHRALYDHTRVPFDLAAGPLVRLALVRLGPGEHLYLVTIHHLATDWITYQIFFAELMALYEALRAGHPRRQTPLAALPPLPVQFPDFAVWEREWLQGEVLEEEARFWRRELAGFPLVLELPADRPRPAVQSQRGGTYRMRLGRERTGRLHAVARREGATPFIMMLAVLFALLGRFTGREKLLVGSNSANRPRPELESVAGYFLTQVPFAGDLTGDPTFRELLARSRRTALAAYAHQNFPFSKLLEALEVEPDRSRFPVVPVLLLILEHQLAAQVGDLTFRPVGLYDGNSRFDFLFGLYDHPEEGFEGPLEYNTDLFDPPTVGRLLELFYRVTDAVGMNPDVRLSELPVFADTARLQVLADLDAGEEPEAEVRERAERLAPALRRLGVGQGESGAKVGLLLEPSPERAALALAVRRLGGVPLPLDPREPAVRLSVLLADADLALLVHRGPLAEELAPVGAVRADVERLADAAS